MLNNIIMHIWYKNEEKIQNKMSKSNTLRRTLYAQIMNMIPNFTIFIS